MTSPDSSPGGAKFGLAQFYWQRDLLSIKETQTTPVLRDLLSAILMPDRRDLSREFYLLSLSS